MIRSIASALSFGGFNPMPSTSLASTVSFSTSISMTAACVRTAQNSFQALGASSHGAFFNVLNHSAKSMASKGFSSGLPRDDGAPAA